MVHVTRQTGRVFEDAYKHVMDRMGKNEGANEKHVTRLLLLRFAFLLAQVMAVAAAAFLGREGVEGATVSADLLVKQVILSDFTNGRVSDWHDGSLV
jgi:hypothetical protein